MIAFATLDGSSVPPSSTRTTRRGAKARLQQSLNLALGNGALRDRLNRGLARANFELIVRPPQERLEAEFEDFLSRCSEYTMTSRERMYAMFQAVRHVVLADVPGDIVECGVWRGGSSMMAALTLLHHGERERRLWLYDTFAGMTEPTVDDIAVDGESAAAEWQRNQRGEVNEWCFSPLEEVRANLLSTGLDAGRLELVEGLVEETLPARRPEAISLLRLDTDWHDSTLHELEHLFPMLSPGGVLILDDYGHWQGARQAADRYLAEHGVTLLLNRIDYSGRLAVKPA